MRNPKQIENSNFLGSKYVSSFCHLTFERASHFDIRISDLNRRPPLPYPLLEDLLQHEQPDIYIPVKHMLTFGILSN